jgi:Zn-finger nucleic acid-binding protein
LILADFGKILDTRTLKGGAMNCPECNVQFRKYSIADDQINECPVCRGLWFEKGQLDAVKDEVMPEMGWVDIDSLKEQFEFKAWTDVLFCPKCHTTSLTKIQDHKTNTEFCICTQCKGTWLSSGQFLNLINLLLDEAYEKSASELAISSIQQAKELLMTSESNISQSQGLKSVLSLLKQRIFIENPKLKSLIKGLKKSLPL